MTYRVYGEKEDNMTLEKLIEKLKKESKNGVYEILANWYKDISDEKCEDWKKEELYNNIHGFIWGLTAMEFLSNKEECELFGDLLNIYNQ